MEEAYKELYQQFLRLRSLCLRQAAMLHQLTTALQKHQGASVIAGEVGEMNLVPSHDSPVYHYQHPQPLVTDEWKHAPPCGVSHAFGNQGAVSGLLADDMAKLSVDTTNQRKQNVKAENINPFCLDSSVCLEASSSTSKLLRSNYSSEVRTYPMPAGSSPYRMDDCLDPAGGAMLSEVALQSHVCEFCQAVFPGEASTRGDFLRHLHTHVT
ncbi:TRAF family member-associated NF-kappa-B activator [Oryzias melastigma]|uniref:TRAF family member-associated NF-kappa-B activator n=1 Tax=Oryzias melastigma TaxID=30732 RepID=A0A834KWK2_ORYME|nr:TRAF family member-associated NF-kappa-B activator [Oryzias melastigma]